jgi:hypothetical protein
MRRIVLIAALLVAGCTPTPDVEPRPPVASPRPLPAAPQQRGDLIGLTAGELVQLLGSPALQIREGQSLKLQFRSAGCILDAYLYRATNGQGVERVTHVDARRRSGAEIDQRQCIAAMAAG